MDAVCEQSDRLCQKYALAAATHALGLYCASISTALICCCSKTRPRWCGIRWRGQNTRGVTSLSLGVIWCCVTGAASLRAGSTVQLVAALLAPLAWLAAETMHVVLWTRRSTAPILFLALYWLLTSASSAAITYQFLLEGISVNDVEVYLNGIGIFLTFIISGVDFLCFYDEITKRSLCRRKVSTQGENTLYLYNDTHFYSKITFFWLNALLYKGYNLPLENEELGETPENESSKIYYTKFQNFFHNQKVKSNGSRNSNIWQCYVRMVWPNFYIAGILRIFSDIASIVPAVGLAALIRFVETKDSNINYNTDSKVTIQEFLENGYVILLIITLALIIQALLSQNSTHLLIVEGSRLKLALQSMIYDKCTRLASWSTDTEVNEDSPLLSTPEEDANTQTGLVMNLISQDTYNIMSCIWILHYTWAIPLKVVAILYILYTKLGISAIIGSLASLILITPLQLYVGKKISDNSREVSKCTDHRISKISEILQGMKVIKLYVWEDLFNEKILQLREVELKLLNKDSVYWGLLSFTIHVSAALITIITFTTHYFLENENTLNSFNVFAALALFNQLTIPLLILPVTILMIIQAVVSTKRIKEFLDLPESYNTQNDDNDETFSEQPADDSFEAFLDVVPEDYPLSEKEELDIKDEDLLSDINNMTNDQGEDFLIRFRNAAFSWKMKESVWLEIESLNITSGKLIMVVGASGSGKSLLLSAILGEMYHERGDVVMNDNCSMWYAGHPPWLLERSIRDNIVMDSTWCQRRYARVLRATDLRPDLQLLPDGDNTQLGSYGSPLSGGQRVRLCVARALYSRAKLIVLDEPLSSLDVPLARHLVTRGLLPATRCGRTVILATNRLELLHYADIVIAMDDGRVSEVGRLSDSHEGMLGQWAQLGGAARAAAARAGAGPPGGAARERARLLHAVSRLQFQKNMSDDAMQMSITEVAGAHLLAETATCAGGGWRDTAKYKRQPLPRQCSSPPPTVDRFNWYRSLRRAVSADEPNVDLQREASMLRRSSNRRPDRSISRWTPSRLQRLLSSDSDKSTHSTQNNATIVEVSQKDVSVTSTSCSGIETVEAPEGTPQPPKGESDMFMDEDTVWWKYARACRWWGVAFCGAALAAQAMAVAADYWLADLAARNARAPLSNAETWGAVRAFALWGAGGVCAAAGAQAAGAGAGAAARRALHERLLRAALHAPLRRHLSQPAGSAIYRFSSDTLVVDKKLPMAINRWTQLALLCGTATLLNAIASPWTLLATIPALLIYIALQRVYLQNARALQNAEAESAAGAVSLAAQTLAGAAAVRAARLRPRMRRAFCRLLDRNHNALLLLNSTNRWLSLSLDILGAAGVLASLGAALAGGGGAARALAGAYALQLPALLAHAGRARAELLAALAAARRLLAAAAEPQEDYRDDCPIPKDWQRKGKLEFQDVTIQYESDSPPVLKNFNFVVNPGQKIAICGRSGSGKSTLLLTCAGAMAITSGRILLDGQDIAHVPLRVLRHRVVVLPQEIVLFSGTLRENLDPLAVHTDEEIWQSLRTVGLFDYVSAQPAGLECGVRAGGAGGAGGGRGGAGGAGGGRRGAWGGARAARLCAARAALRARLAAALLLDEPGAALDAAAERALLAAVAAAAPGASVLAVAHRVSSARECDGALELERPPGAATSSLLDTQSPQVTRIAT